MLQQTTLPLLNTVEQHPSGIKVWTKFPHSFRAGDVVYINSGNYKNVLDEEELDDAMFILEEEQRNIGSKVLLVDAEKNWLIVETPYVAPRHYDNPQSESFSLLDNLDTLLEQDTASAQLDVETVFNQKDKGFVEEVIITNSYFEAPQIQNSSWEAGLAGMDRGQSDISSDFVQRHVDVSRDKVEDDHYNTMLQYYSSSWDEVLQEPIEPNSTRPFPWFDTGNVWKSGIFANGFWTGSSVWSDNTAIAKWESVVDEETGVVERVEWDGFPYQYSRLKRGLWKSVSNADEADWNGGLWEKGIWDGTTWKKGRMQGGVVLSGTWESGTADSVNNTIQFPYPVEITDLGHKTQDNLLTIDHWTWKSGQAWECVWNWGQWQHGEWYGAARQQWSVTASWNSGANLHDLNISVADHKERDSYAWRLSQGDLISLSNSGKASSENVARLVQSSDTDYSHNIQIFLTEHLDEDVDYTVSATPSIWNVGQWVDGTWKNGTKNDASLYIKRRVTEDYVASVDEFQAYASYANPIDYNRTLGNLVTYNIGYPFYLTQGEFDNTLPQVNFKITTWNLGQEQLDYADFVDTVYATTDTLDSGLNNASDGILLSKPALYDPYTYSPQQVDYNQWLNGTWEDGLWLGGIWRDGTWENGRHNSGTWVSGAWLNGTWESGYWYDGTWYDGTWTSQLNWVAQSSIEHADIREGVIEPWDNEFKPVYSVWRNGIFSGGTWLNGLWIEGTFAGGQFLDGGIIDVDWRGGSYDPVVVYGDNLTEPDFSAYNTDFDFTSFDASPAYYLNNALAYQPGYRMYFPYQGAVTDIDRVDYQTVGSDDIYQLLISADFQDRTDQWYTDTVSTNGEITPSVIPFNSFGPSWQTNLNQQTWIRAVDSSLFQDISMEANGVVAWHHALYDVSWYGGDFQLNWRSKPDQFQTIFNKQRPLDMSIAAFFIDGTWYNGTFHRGSFNPGTDASVHDKQRSLLSSPIIIEEYDYATWLDGRFLDGYWYGGSAQGGRFTSGYFIRGHFSTDHTRLLVEGGNWGTVEEADIRQWNPDPLLRPNFEKNPYYLTDIKWDRDETGSTDYSLQCRSIYFDKADDANGFDINRYEAGKLDRVVALSQTFYPVKYRVDSVFSDGTYLNAVINQSDIVFNDVTQDSQLWVRLTGARYTNNEPEKVVNGFHRVIAIDNSVPGRTSFTLNLEMSESQINSVRFDSVYLGESEIRRAYGERQTPSLYNVTSSSNAFTYSMANEKGFVKISSWMDRNNGALNTPLYRQTESGTDSAATLINDFSWKNTHKLQADKHYVTSPIAQSDTDPSLYNAYNLDVTPESRYYNLVFERTSNIMQVENTVVNNAYFKGDLDNLGTEDGLDKSVVKNCFVQGFKTLQSTLTDAIINASIIDTCVLNSTLITGRNPYGLVLMSSYTRIKGNTNTNQTDRTLLTAPEEINIWSVSDDILIEEPLGSGLAALWATSYQKAPLLGIWWEGIDSASLDIKDGLLCSRGFYLDHNNDIVPSTGTSASAAMHDKILGTKSVRPLSIIKTQQDLGIIDTDAYGALIVWGGSYRNGSWYDTAASNETWYNADVTPGSVNAPLSPAKTDLFTVNTISAVNSNIAYVEPLTSPQMLMTNNKLTFSVFDDYLDQDQIESVAPYAVFCSRAFEGVLYQNGNVKDCVVSQSELIGGKINNSILYSELQGFSHASQDLYSYQQLDGLNQLVDSRDTSGRSYKSYTTSAQAEFSTSVSGNAVLTFVAQTAEVSSGSDYLIPVTGGREGFALSSNALYRVTVANDVTTLQGIIATSDSDNAVTSIAWDVDFIRSVQSMTGTVQLTFEQLTHLDNVSQGDVTPYANLGRKAYSINSKPVQAKTLPGPVTDGFTWYGLDINERQYNNFQCQYYYPSNLVNRGADLENSAWFSGTWFNGDKSVTSDGNTTPRFTADLNTLPIWGDGILRGGTLAGTKTADEDGLPRPNLVWVMGFFQSGQLRNCRWMRGYCQGGTWLSGEWDSFDYNTGVLNYVDDEYKSLSYWISGVWKSINDLDQADVTASTWSDGIWLGESGLTVDNVLDPMSIERMVQEASWNGPYRVFEIDNEKTVILNSATSIWLGGTWKRGLWSGGIFYGGIWEAAPYTSRQDIEETVEISALYDPSLSQNIGNAKYKETPITGQKDGVEPPVYSMTYSVEWRDENNVLQFDNNLQLTGIEFTDYDPVAGTFNIASGSDINNTPAATGFPSAASAPDVNPGNNRAFLELSNIKSDLQFGDDNPVTAQSETFSDVNYLTWWVQPDTLVNDFYAVIALGDIAATTNIGYLRKVKNSGSFEISIKDDTVVLYRLFNAATLNDARALLTGGSIYQDYISVPSNPAYGAASAFASSFSSTFSPTFGGGVSLTWVDTNTHSNTDSGFSIPLWDVSSASVESWNEGVGINSITYNTGTGTYDETTLYTEVVFDNEDGTPSGHPPQVTGSPASVITDNDVSSGSYSYVQLALRSGTHVVRPGGETAPNREYDYRTLGNLAVDLDLEWAGQEFTKDTHFPAVTSDHFYSTTDASKTGTPLDAINESVTFDVNVFDISGASLLPLSSPFTITNSIITESGVAGQPLTSYEAQFNFELSSSTGATTLQNVGSKASPNGFYSSDNTPSTYRYPETDPNRTFNPVPDVITSVSASNSLQDWDFNGGDPAYHSYQLKHRNYPSVFYRGQFLRSVWEGGSFAPSKRYETYANGWDEVEVLVPQVLVNDGRSRDIDAIFGDYVPQQRDWTSLNDGFSYDTPLLTDNIFFVKDDSNFTVETPLQSDNWSYYQPRSGSFYRYLGKRLFRPEQYDPRTNLSDAYLTSGIALDVPMTSTWQRGVFNQGVMQWSIWDNRDLSIVNNEVETDVEGNPIGQYRRLDIWPSVARIGRPDTDNLNQNDTLQVYSNNDATSESSRNFLNPSIMLGGMTLWSTWYGGESVSYRHVFNRSRWVTGIWNPLQDPADANFVARQYDTLFGNPNQYIREGRDITPQLNSYQFVEPVAPYDKAIVMSGRNLQSDFNVIFDYSIPPGDVSVNPFNTLVITLGSNNVDLLLNLQAGDFVFVNMTAEYDDGFNTPFSISETLIVLDVQIDDVNNPTEVEISFEGSPFPALGEFDDFRPVPTDDVTLRQSEFPVYVMLGREIYPLGQSFFPYGFFEEHGFLRYIDALGNDIDLEDIISGVEQPTDTLRLDFKRTSDVNGFLKYWWDELDYDASSLYVATTNGVDGIRDRIYDTADNTVLSRNRLAELSQHQLHQSVWQSGQWTNGLMSQSTWVSGFNPLEEPVVGLPVGNTTTDELTLLGNVIANGGLDHALYDVNIDERGFIRNNGFWRDFSQELTLAENGLYEAWSETHAGISDVSRLFPEYRQLFLHDNYATEFINKTRFAGNVDNFASQWLKGRVEGSFWNGGLWYDGEFYHRDVLGDGDKRDYFDDVIPLNQTNSQISVWSRGIWLSGIFSKRQFTNPYINTDTGQGDQRYLRCWFMSVDLPRQDVDTLVYDNTSALGVTLGWLRSKIEYKLDSKPAVEQGGEWYFRDLNQTASWFTRLNRIDTSLELSSEADVVTLREDIDRRHLTSADFRPSAYRTYYPANLLTHYGVVREADTDTDETILRIDSDYYDENPHHLSFYQWSEFNGTFLSGVFYDLFKRDCYVMDDSGVPQQTPLLTGYAEWGNNRARIAPDNSEKDRQPLGNQNYSLRLAKTGSNFTTYSIGPADPYNTTDWENAPFFYPLFMSTRHWRRTGIDHVNIDLLGIEESQSEPAAALPENVQTIQVLNPSVSRVNEELRSTPGLPLATPLYTQAEQPEGLFDLALATLRFEKNSIKNTILQESIIPFDFYGRTRAMSNFFSNTAVNDRDIVTSGSSVDAQDDNYSSSVSLQEDGILWANIPQEDIFSIHKASSNDNLYPLFGGGTRKYVKAFSEDFGNNWNVINHVEPDGIFLDFSSVTLDAYSEVNISGVAMGIDITIGQQLIQIVWDRADSFLVSADIKITDSDIPFFVNGPGVILKNSARIITDESDGAIKAYWDKDLGLKLYFDTLEEVTWNVIASPVTSQQPIVTRIIQENAFNIQDSRCRSFGNTFIDFNGRVYQRQSDNTYRWQSYINESPDNEIIDITGEQYSSYCIIKDTNEVILQAMLTRGFGVCSTLVTGSELRITLNDSAHLLRPLRALEGQRVTLIHNLQGFLNRTSNSIDPYAFRARIGFISAPNTSQPGCDPNSAAITVTIEDFETTTPAAAEADVLAADKVYLMSPYLTTFSEETYFRPAPYDQEANGTINEPDPITRRVKFSQNGIDWSDIAVYRESDNAAGELIDPSDSSIISDSMPTAIVIKDGVLWLATSDSRVYYYNGTWNEQLIQNRDSGVYIRSLTIHQGKIYAVGYKTYTDWELYFTTNSQFGVPMFAEKKGQPNNFYTMLLDEDNDRWVTLDNFKDVNITFDYNNFNLMAGERSSSTSVFATQPRIFGTEFNGAFGGTLGYDDFVSDQGLTKFSYRAQQNMFKANRQSLVEIQSTGDSLVVLQRESADNTKSGFGEWGSRNLSISKMRRSAQNNINSWQDLNIGREIEIHGLTNDNIYTRNFSIYKILQNSVPLLSGSTTNNFVTSISPVNSSTVSNQSVFLRNLFNYYTLTGGFNGNVSLARNNKLLYPVSETERAYETQPDIYTMSPISTFYGALPMRMTRMSSHGSPLPEQNNGPTADLGEQLHTFAGDGHIGYYLQSKNSLYKDNTTPLEDSPLTWDYEDIDIWTSVKILSDTGWDNETPKNVSQNKDLSTYIFYGSHTAENNWIFRNWDRSSEIGVGDTYDVQALTPNATSPLGPQYQRYNLAVNVKAPRSAWVGSNSALVISRCGMSYENNLNSSTLQFTRTDDGYHDGDLVYFHGRYPHDEFLNNISPAIDLPYYQNQSFVIGESQFNCSGVRRITSSGTTHTVKNDIMRDYDVIVPRGSVRNEDTNFFDPVVIDGETVGYRIPYSKWSYDEYFNVLRPRWIDVIYPSNISSLNFFDCVWDRTSDDEIDWFDDHTWPVIQGGSMPTDTGTGATSGTPDLDFDNSSILYVACSNGYIMRVDTDFSSSGPNSSHFNFYQVDSEGRDLYSVHVQQDDLGNYYLLVAGQDGIAYYLTDDNYNNNTATISEGWDIIGESSSWNIINGITPRDIYDIAGHDPDNMAADENVKPNTIRGYFQSSRIPQERIDPSDTFSPTRTIGAKMAFASATGDMIEVNVSGDQPPFRVIRYTPVSNVYPVRELDIRIVHIMSQAQGFNAPLEKLITMSNYQVAALSAGTKFDYALTRKYYFDYMDYDSIADSLQSSLNNVPNGLIDQLGQTAASDLILNISGPNASLSEGRESPRGNLKNALSKEVLTDQPPEEISYKVARTSFDDEFVSLFLRRPPLLNGMIERVGWSTQDFYYFTTNSFSNRILDLYNYGYWSKQGNDTAYYGMFTHPYQVLPVAENVRFKDVLIGVKWRGFFIDNPPNRTQQSDYRYTFGDSMSFLYVDARVNPDLSPDQTRDSFSFRTRLVQQLLSGYTRKKAEFYLDRVIEQNQ